MISVIEFADSAQAIITVQPHNLPSAIHECQHASISSSRIGICP